MSAYARHAHLRTPIMSHQCVLRVWATRASRHWLQTNPPRAGTTLRRGPDHEPSMRTQLILAMSERYTSVWRDLDTSVKSSPLSGDLSAANACSSSSPIRGATAYAPGFGVSADTHGLTDALMCTDATRRDDACPDAAGRLSLLNKPTLVEIQSRTCA